jgi:hypothetical protein
VFECRKRVDMSAWYSNNIWLVFIGILIAILSIAILSKPK